jgi:rhodanese-related sulfurtransferase
MKISKEFTNKQFMIQYNNQQKEFFMFLNRLTILMLIFTMSFFFGCSDSTSNDDKASNFELIQPTVDEALTAGKGAPISAEELHDNMDDYFIVSVRAASAYETGHIPGAINIPWKTVADDASLAMLPTDKTQKLAVYCYTGHTGALATGVLNALGYDASNIKFGMCAWTKNDTVRVAKPFTEEDYYDYPVETIENTPGTYDLADPNYVSSQDADEVMQAAALAYLTDPDIKGTYDPETLHTLITDEDPSNDPQILSVRAASAYATGHIPGAINIPWKDVGKEENLKKLDPDRDIVVYCYTGHTGGIATAALNLLGYKATNLRHGMCSWTKDAAVRVTDKYFKEADTWDYPYNTGVNP